MSDTNNPSTVFDMDDYCLGARVYATKATGVCSRGEKGYVVEAYEIAGRQGRSILFEGGDFDGFSPEDLASMTVPEGSINSQLAHYVFISVGRLKDDARRQSRFAFEKFAPYEACIAAREKTAIQDCLPPRAFGAPKDGPRL